MTYDYKIMFEEGTSPINVRPYIYHASLNDEIEKMIKEMLESGVIRPSVSLYASPIVMLSKCYFGRTKVDYLGHIITQEGVTANPSKISVMKNWSLPKTDKEIRGYLGLTCYYWRFAKGYGVMARPLTDLLKKEKFEWSVEAIVAFEQLKVAMSTTPVLALPNFYLEFVIETDDCGLGIWTVLMHVEHPLTI
ncbi:putative mitochondrial protein AtMg00860 [Nicotiana tabacum]|uniref:Mitochondrial protein AtMg00860 n=1 Tax=Nicotiana tabacum TaxID=4097 RepID=A0AC58TLA7_TOBAC